MKRLILILFAILSFLSLSAQDTLRHEVLFRTDKGNIRVVLYNETPLHRDNFIKQVKSGTYDGLLFHRVIKGFMIQTGDTASRHAMPGEFLGNTLETNTIPAEFRLPYLFHKRGAVAAAREGDAENPEQESSECQFYIVYGTDCTDAMLDRTQQKLDERTGGKVKLTQEMRDVYKIKGGSPHLDGQYTVFGEITEGMDVVSAIQSVETDKNARPLQDVKIINAVVCK